MSQNFIYLISDWTSGESTKPMRNHTYSARSSARTAKRELSASNPTNTYRILRMPYRHDQVETIS